MSLPRTPLTSLDRVAAAQRSHAWRRWSEGKQESDRGKAKQGGRQHADGALTAAKSSPEFHP